MSKTQLVILLGYVACGPSPEEAAAKRAKREAAEKKAKAEKKIRAPATAALKKEPKIKQLDWNGNYLNVYVVHDGTPRDGFAMYVCEVLREHNAAAGVSVKVQSQDGTKKLGESAC